MKELTQANTIRTKDLGQLLSLLHLEGAEMFNLNETKLVQANITPTKRKSSRSRLLQPLK